VSQNSVDNLSLTQTLPHKHQDGRQNFLSGERKISLVVPIFRAPSLTHTWGGGKLPLAREEVLPCALILGAIHTLTHNWGGGKLPLAREEVLPGGSYFQSPPPSLTLEEGENFLSLERKFSQVVRMFRAPHPHSHLRSGKTSSRSRGSSSLRSHFKSPPHPHTLTTP
jgi:hypothetical protein